MRFGLLNEMSGFVWRPVNNPNDEGVDPSRSESIRVGPSVLRAVPAKRLSSRQRGCSYLPCIIGIHGPMGLWELRSFWDDKSSPGIYSAGNVEEPSRPIGLSG